jgi:hypothetical protein
MECPFASDFDFKKNAPHSEDLSHMGTGLHFTMTYLGFFKVSPRLLFLADRKIIDCKIAPETYGFMEIFQISASIIKRKFCFPDDSCIHQCSHDSFARYTACRK